MMLNPADLGGQCVKLYYGQPLVGFRELKLSLEPVGAILARSRAIRLGSDFLSYSPCLCLWGFSFG